MHAKKTFDIPSKNNTKNKEKEKKRITIAKPNFMDLSQYKTTFFIDNINELNLIRKWVILYKTIEFEPKVPEIPAETPRILRQKTSKVKATQKFNLKEE